MLIVVVLDGGTGLGRSLQQQVRALEQWAIENMGAVTARQREYDRAGAGRLLTNP